MHRAATRQRRLCRKFCVFHVAFGTVCIKTTACSGIDFIASQGQPFRKTQRFFLNAVCNRTVTRRLFDCHCHAAAITHAQVLLVIA
ncbi:hypothetical protein LL965_16550 [Xanthomonas cassavae CFBP 4642]|uniref:Secreted protein n=1 Tax=Xanthomonas cassavae CFBP 4642 TaxID=1219375 RepID=A0ABS8HHF7_9XANT|nr:hypothetical protein [Xanthomonas cassavae CFBP 4642]